MKLDRFSWDWFGSARTVTISKEQTTIVDGKGNETAINNRIEDLQKQIDNAKTPFEREQLQNRLAKMVGGVSIIHVGGFTETEMKEKKDRVDDALHATRAAVEEGIVAGGGVALLRAKSVLDKIKADNADEATGIQIISRAVESPLRTIVENAGLEGSVVVAKVAEGKGDFGYNAKTDEYVDMLKAGIIDPKKVTRVALENAASVAGMILTTECALVEIKEENAGGGMPMGGGMPGMM
jgi:chaperonin GroEL